MFTILGLLVFLFVLYAVAVRYDVVDGFGVETKVLGKKVSIVVDDDTTCIKVD